MGQFSQAVTTVITEMQRTIKHAGVNARVPDIIAISKRQPEDRIEEALAMGWRRFGENQVQEAADRWEHRRPLLPDLELHLVGPLQSNKVAQAVAQFDVIHTVDREKIARKLAQEMAKQDRWLPCFIQVNTGNEPQKSGVSLDALADFVPFVRDDLKLPVKGLMCLPPRDEDPALHFGLLKKLAKRHELPDLSMGMSGDYPIAAAMGARYVRLGTSLFGERPANWAGVTHQAEPALSAE